MISITVGLVLYFYNALKITISGLHDNSLEFFTNGFTS